MCSVFNLPIHSATQVAPAISKSFATSTVSINGAVGLTFHLSNPNSDTALNAIAFYDTLPSGLLVATPNGLTGECGGGTITADTGSSAISLSGATLAAGASCSFAVNVTGIAAGLQTNTVSATSSGGNSKIASASVMVQPTDAYQIGYASNLAIGDSFVNITNAGMDPAANICVNVYTFDATQNLVACCSCALPPSGLKSLSARGDLISNTLTTSVPNSIIIKLLASTPVSGTCDPASPTASNLVQGMQAWATTIHSRFTTPTTYGSTEESFQSAFLSPGVLAQATLLCRFIQGDGGGYGICKSCRTGGLGADKR